MARRYYRKRRKQDPTITMIFVLGLIAVTYLTSLPVEKLQFFIVVAILAVFIIFAAALFIKHKIHQRELKKLRALEIIDTDYMDGLAFEKYVAELLKNQGYKRVTLTERYDLGIDIIAVKDGVRWGVQVKRYSNMVKAEAVRQVVTALNNYNCQRAMVVTNSTFSRPAKVLAETNDCVLIGKEEIADWIISFQEGK